LLHLKRLQILAIKERAAESPMIPQKSKKERGIPQFLRHLKNNGLRINIDCRKSTS
jgi:hypothetical protein